MNVCRCAVPAQLQLSISMKGGCTIEKTHFPYRVMHQVAVLPCSSLAEPYTPRAKLARRRRHPPTPLSRGRLPATSLAYPP